MPECIESCFKYVSTLSCNNRVWQTIPYVNNPVSKTVFTQIILKSYFLQSHIITSHSKCACFSLGYLKICNFITFGSLEALNTQEIF